MLEWSCVGHEELVDGNDPYGLRPTTVTVQLQARTAVVQPDGTTGQYSEWTDAYSVWTSLHLKKTWQIRVSPRNQPIELSMPMTMVGVDHGLASCVGTFNR